MNARTIVKTILGTALLGLGVALSAAPALATSVPQSTTISLTVPATLTCSGLAATSSGTSPAGVVAHITSGFVGCVTNNSAGYSISAQAGTANFTPSVGTGVLAASADSISIVAPCPAGGTCAAAQALSSTTAIQIFSRSNPAASPGDQLNVDNAITIPAGLAAATYSLTVTYTGTTF